MPGTSFNLELAAVLAAALLAAYPPPGAGVWRRIDRAVESLSRTHRRAALTAAISTFALAAILGSAGGRPLPRIADESSYLLAADTYASGRLTNPPHPLWPHFETQHVLVTPSYQSKYPPGPGLMLALGQIVGNPLAGAWLGLALAAAALAWMFAALVPRRFALLGGLLPVLRIGMARDPGHLLFGYWAKSFWGGSAALLGAALVLGGAARLARASRARDALWLGIGLVVLANSRPYEGAVVAAPALGWLVAARRRERLGAGTRVLVALALVLLPGAAATLAYNWRITASPLTLPHRAYQTIYEGVPYLLFERVEPAVRADAYPALGDYVAYRRRDYDGLHSLGGFLRSRAVAVRDLVLNYLGAALGVATLAAVGCLAAARPRGARRRVLGAAVLLFGWCFAAESLISIRRLLPHYWAPAAPLLYLLAVEGLRRLRIWRFRGEAVGRRLARGILVICALTFAAGTWAWSRTPVPDGDGFELDRARIAAQLERMGGRHLVIVRHGPGHSFHDEWISNRAGIDAAAVVWARDLGPERDRSLRSYFADRRVWLVEADGARRLRSWKQESGDRSE
jgi:hypothetical protein